MPPQQPYYGQPSPPERGPEQYDFIMNSGAKRRGPLMSSSFSSRLLLALGGAFVLIIVAWIFLSIVRKSPHVDSPQLITIMQDQYELIQISAAAINSADSQTTRNFAKTVQLNLETDQNMLQAYMAKHNIKVKKSVIHLLPANSKATDATLATAKTNGDYDQVYTQIAQSQLSAYQIALSQTYKMAQLHSEQLLLTNAFNDAKLLQAFSTQQE